MKIGNFEITADKLNFILTETYEGKDKEGNTKTHTSEQRYYGRLEDALQAIVTKAETDHVFGDAATLIAGIAMVRDSIVQALREQDIPTRKAA